MDEKNLVVVKHNTLIEASYRLNLSEQRLLLACIAQIDSTNTLEKKDSFTITAKHYSSLFNIPLNHTYEQIEKASEELFERKITLQNGKKRKVTRWISDVEYDRGLGQVTLGFAPKIIPYLSQLKGSFTKYRLENISQLKSVHTIRIYEMCTQYIAIGQREITLKDLKAFLGVSEAYPEFKEFNKYVLKPALSQINKHTDLKVSVTPIRHMKKITAFNFRMAYKTKAKPRSHRASEQKINKTLQSITPEILLDPKKTKNHKPYFTIH